VLRHHHHAHELRPALGAAVSAASLAVLATAIATGGGPGQVAPVAILVAALAIGATRAYQALLQWRSLVALLIVVIFFIPIKRYTLPGSLPFDLEPYRVIVALVILCWLTSLLIDRALQLHGSVLDWPLLVILFAVLGSAIVNPGRVSGVGLAVPKSLTFFLSYLFVYYLLVSVVRTQEALDGLVKLLVICGGILGLLAIVEARTNYNFFDNLQSLIPLLRYRTFNDTAFSASELGRGGRLRVYASAQHPIALAALLVMLLPLCVYLARKTRQRRWWVCGLLMAVGMLGTQSRTGVIMLLVVVLVFLWLRPKETRRLWPALIPLLAIVQVLMPHTIGNLKSAFFPQGGLVAEQAHVVRANQLQYGHGRLATVGPTFAQVSEQPLLGVGYGTRITSGLPETINAIVLDNAWLGTLLEVGFIGALGYVWLFGRAVRKLGHLARHDHGDRGWLAVAIAAGIASFAIGMLTYDAFSFVQVTFMTFIMLGLASVLLSIVEREQDPAAAA
jgi:hypothetical protein